MNIEVNFVKSATKKVVIIDIDPIISRSSVHVVGDVDLELLLSMIHSFMVAYTVKQRRKYVVTNVVVLVLLVIGKAHITTNFFATGAHSRY
jgi:hypothetical protein